MGKPIGNNGNGDSGNGGNPGSGGGTQTTLSTNLRAWRKNKGLLLKQVSAALGVSLSTLAAWECGTRFATSEHLDAISHLLDVPVSCLFCSRFVDCINDGDGQCCGKNGDGAVPMSLT